jgi:hypothetical protein
MPVEFDDEVGFEGQLLIGWANLGSKRIRCLAGRETINELPGFIHASASDIRNKKHEIFDKLKPLFVKKIEEREFDRSTIPSVTVYLHDLAAAR